MTLICSGNIVLYVAKQNCLFGEFRVDVIHPGVGVVFDSYWGCSVGFLQNVLAYRTPLTPKGWVCCAINTFKMGLISQEMVVKF